MLDLETQIAGFADGAAVPVALVLAVLLGLRHATDPDHLAALATLSAGTERRTSRGAGALGLAWGLGHGLTLSAFGAPLIFFGRGLPEAAREGAEAAIGVMIVVLSLRLLRQWRRGKLHLHEHEHEGRIRHVHIHAHAGAQNHRHEHAPRTRLRAFGIGLLHGLSGSAGATVLVLAAVESNVVALVSLILLAGGAALTMTVLSTGFGLVFVRPSALDRLRPLLGTAGLSFGVWYGLAALDLLR